MKLSDISIQRPVFASMTSAALVLFGVIGYKQLAVREFPDVDPPIVSVSVTLRGANPQPYPPLCRSLLMCGDSIIGSRGRCRGRRQDRVHARVA